GRRTRVRPVRPPRTAARTDGPAYQRQLPPPNHDRVQCPAGTHAAHRSRHLGEPLVEQLDVPVDVVIGTTVVARRGQDGDREGIPCPREGVYEVDTRHERLHAGDEF